MAAKHVHHYVPQFYLRGFTDPAATPGMTPWLWVFDKTSKKVSRRAPKNLAAAIGFYAVEGANGSDFVSVENELAAMENRAAFALRQFLSAPAGNRGGIPTGLGIFLGWLAARVPWFDRASKERWEKFIQDAADGRESVPDSQQFALTLVERTTGEKLIFAYDEGLAAMRTRRWKPELDKNQRAELMRVQAWYFERHFQNLQWTLLTAPTNTFFITSDRPVVWHIPEVGGADSPAALEHPSVELTVPLSARYAFLATKDRPLTDATIRPSDLNRRTFLLCEKFVASPTVKEIFEFGT